MTEASLAEAAPTAALRSARDLLLTHRLDYDAARRDFRWPELSDFNWALDWFDVIARDNKRAALWVVEQDGTEAQLSFEALSQRSSQVAAWLDQHGVRRGDRVLLMVGNRVALWECMLALIKLGAVMIPASTLLTADDIADRITRGGVAHVIAETAQTPGFAGAPSEITRVVVGEPADGWLDYAASRRAAPEFTPGGASRAGDPLLLYFTSGTTAQPKLVEHTHASYPVGHLSTMYWLGLQPGDIHLNLSSPGWAKHAWSNVFAPWNAEATVTIYNYARFAAAELLEVMARCGVTTFCAPPTVWRMLVQENLGRWNLPLRELVSAGEPLNPEVIDTVRRAWGLTIRDGYGQTETTAQIGNPPGQPLKPGSMGRPLPGYVISLLDPQSDATADEGEIAIDLAARPLGLMTGYRDDARRTAEVMRGGHYHTGDIASRDSDGYVTYVGRADDVFKASDYRISPFELESVLIEHEAVAEAAIVPSPDPIRLAVPKAFVVLAAGHQPDAATALSILGYARKHLAAYKRVRRIEFTELPKTISGKIRRVELREQEEARHRGPPPGRADSEWWEEDFPELRSPST